MEVEDAEVSDVVVVGKRGNKGGTELGRDLWVCWATGVVASSSTWSVHGVP